MTNTFFKQKFCYEKDKNDLENFGGIEIKEYKEEKDKEEDIIKKL